MWRKGAVPLLCYQMPSKGEKYNKVRKTSIRCVIKISGTEFIAGKRKHLRVTRSYLPQSTTLPIVCSDSSDASPFNACLVGLFGNGLQPPCRI
jgi:hypothetical protein